MCLRAGAGCPAGHCGGYDARYRGGGRSSPPWDAAAFALFEKRGLAPPRTVSTLESGGVIDLNWIREAIAEAKVVPREAEAVRAAAESRSVPISLGAEDAGESAEGAAAEDSPLAASEALVRVESLFLFPEKDSPNRALDRNSSVATGASSPEAEPAVAESMLRTVSARSTDARDGNVVSAIETPRKLDARLLTPPRLGKILVMNEEGRFESLVPRALRLQVFVEGPRARTVVDYVFSNPHDRRLEGTFYYPLPADASPAAFGMFPGTAKIEPSAFGGQSLLPPLFATAPGAGDGAGLLAALAPSKPPADSAILTEAALVKDWGELQIASVVPATRAREVYEQIVRRDIDPALLEWSGGNTFAARVFPIEPHSVKRVVLVYEETLPVGGDLLRYTYPLPDAEELGRIDFRLSVAAEHSKLAAGAVISQAWAPPTVRDGWTTHYLDLAPRAGASIDLAFMPRDPRAQVLEASAPRGLPGSAFFARLRPDLPATEQAARTGRALFLVDTSLSGAGSAEGSSVLLLEKILELDGTVDEYAVVLFDLRARWLHAPSWRPNDAASRKETLDEISKIYLEGATSFDATLEELDRQRSWLFDAAKPVHAFLLSDGFITWGQDHADVLLARHESAASCRWISYQLGRSPVNRSLFDALARVSRGRTVTVLTRGEIPAGALAHRTSPAVLKGVTVEGVEPADLVVAGDPALLFPGEEIQIAGRLASAGAGAELVVAASIDGKDAAWRVPLQGGGASTMAARAWAELQAAKLLALDDERLDRMITALSQRFQLANRTASFLILEKEADYTELDLEAETIDLEALEKLRISEEDQRRDRLQGIALDGAPELGIETVAILGRVAESGVAIVPAALPPAFLDRPLAGGDERIAAEAAYREARAKNDLDSRTYDAVARVRAVSGDSVGALRAYSSLVEKMPGSAEAARLAGYACMALGQYAPAAEVFERVRLDRPFEPQSYLEEAMALEAARDWGKAARNYEIILSRSFPRHEGESRIVAGRRYARLLAKRLRDEGLDAESRKVLEGRRAEITSLEEVDVLEDVDLEVTIHWNTSSTDVDLWVREPEGERCYYEHRESAAGGRLFWDITDGYGPEIYTRKKAGPGVFEVLAHYFGNNSARWSVPTAVLVLRDRGGSAPWEGAAPRCQVRILGAEDAVLSLVKEEF